MTERDYDFSRLTGDTRAAQGMTQTAFGVALGLRESSAAAIVSSWENGLRSPRPALLGQLVNSPVPWIAAFARQATTLLYGMQARRLPQTQTPAPAATQE